MAELPAPPSVLCHPDGRKSCGACCGMYNVKDADEPSTMSRIATRTSAFEQTADTRDRESLRRFREEWEITEPKEKLLTDLPNCPFLGVLPDHSDSPSCVGCLVHPLQNDGADGRDEGVYDQETCDTYLCAAHNLLKEHEKALVIAACSTSYLYGLVITDPKFVRELFERAATLNGAMPRADRLSAGVRSAANYFELKVDWPFRAPDGVFGQLHAGEGLDTPRRKRSHEVLGVGPSPWDAILNCLGSEIGSTEDLDRARAVVAERVRAFAESVA